jgi:hypothetical protein
MSGPIVRKYGFPNFEKIFGERPIQHGADDAEANETASGRPPDPRQAGKPKDASGASQSARIAPATEFGSTAE